MDRRSKRSGGAARSGGHQGTLDAVSSRGPLPSIGMADMDAVLPRIAQVRAALQAMDARSRLVCLVDVDTVVCVSP